MNSFIWTCCIPDSNPRSESMETDLGDKTFTGGTELSLEILWILPLMNTVYSKILFIRYEFLPLSKWFLALRFYYNPNSLRRQYSFIVCVTADLAWHIHFRVWTSESAESYAAVQNWVLYTATEKVSVCHGNFHLFISESSQGYNLFVGNSNSVIHFIFSNAMSSTSRQLLIAFRLS